MRITSLIISLCMAFLASLCLSGIAPDLHWGWHFLVGLIIGVVFSL